MDGYRQYKKSDQCPTCNHTFSKHKHTIKGKTRSDFKKRICLETVGNVKGFLIACACDGNRSGGLEQVKLIGGITA